MTHISRRTFKYVYCPGDLSFYRGYSVYESFYVGAFSVWDPSGKFLNFNTLEFDSRFSTECTSRNLHDVLIQIDLVVNREGINEIYRN